MILNLKSKELNVELFYIILNENKNKMRLNSKKTHFNKFVRNDHNLSLKALYTII